MSLIDDIRSAINCRIAENEPMSAHTTLGVGGPADIWVEVETEFDLAKLMRVIHDSGTPWMVVGDGANLLVSDKGIRGVVIAPRGEFTEISVDGLHIRSGAAARISTVADIAAENNLIGLEGVGTVPGSVGGAIVMNAGTHRGYIDSVTESVSTVTEDGRQVVLSKEDCGFAYRGSRFQTDHSFIIASAVFAMQRGDGAASRQHLDEVRKHRAETQPQGRSAGCFFKNPPPSQEGAGGRSAGKLIELSGCKGWREGGAVVSDTHGNFIMNTGDATASDLRTLAERVRAMVREKQGIELEYEVRLVGEW